jgi:hypothetical protein
MQDYYLTLRMFQCVCVNAICVSVSVRVNICMNTTDDRINVHLTTATTCRERRHARRLKINQCMHINTIHASHLACIHAHTCQHPHPHTHTHILYAVGMGMAHTNACAMMDFPGTD